MSTAHKNLSTSNLIPQKWFKKLHIAIVVSEWNAEITQALHQAAISFLKEQGVKPDCLHTFYVPGTFELPLACKWYAHSSQYDAVIALGCVIQGETRHFDFICDAAAHGIMNVSLETNKPVVFGVLTTNTMQQAKDRAGGKHGNKGTEAAETALKMCVLQKGTKR